MASSRKKNDAPPVRRMDTEGKWSDLATPGDVRRCLRWVILGTASDKLDVRKAGVMGQLCLYMLKAIEMETLTDRLAAIEHRLDQTEHSQNVIFYEPHDPTPTH
jgi:hypothetical protein